MTEHPHATNTNNHASTILGAAGTSAPAPTTTITAARALKPADSTMAEVRFAVLSSSSAGNASVLIVGSGENYRIIMIDAGLSPRRTQALMKSIGLDSRRIDHVVLTHMHADHIHKTWTRAIGRRVTMWIPRPHLKWAERIGLMRTRTEVIEPDAATEHPITRGIILKAAMAPHDELGSATFRFECPAPTGTSTLSYATDLGSVPEYFPEFLQSTDIFAIESNYDPRMQVRSGRHQILIGRVMGGAGHLSNEEAASLAQAVQPANALVLLHLSRDCNTPKLALQSHQDRVSCPVIAAPHNAPIDPITLVHLT